VPESSKPNQILEIMKTKLASLKMEVIITLRSEKIITLREVKKGTGGERQFLIVRAENKMSSSLKQCLYLQRVGELDPKSELCWSLIVSIKVIDKIEY